MKKDFYVAAHGSFLHAASISSNNFSEFEDLLLLATFSQLPSVSRCHLLKYYFSLVPSNMICNLGILVCLIILLVITT